MFDNNQKRTLRIAMMAIVVGFVLSMFGGCEGVDEATGGNTGTETSINTATVTATSTSTASATATTISTASFTTTVTATFVANTTVTTTNTVAGTTVTYTSVAVSTRPVINVNNPCVTATGCTQHVNNGMQIVDLITCGWESVSGTCYATSWCEPSVASVGTNAAYGTCGGAGPACSAVANSYQLTDTLVRLRPRSAACSAVGTYTFKAGALMVWGTKASGSQYRSNAFQDDGYICVPSSEDLTVNC